MIGRTTAIDHLYTEFWLIAIGISCLADGGFQTSDITSVN